MGQSASRLSPRAISGFEIDELNATSSPNNGVFAASDHTDIDNQVGDSSVPPVNVWPFRSSRRSMSSVTGRSQSPRTRRRLSSFLLNFSRRSPSSGSDSDPLSDVSDGRDNGPLGTKALGQRSNGNNNVTRDEYAIDEDERDEQENVHEQLVHDEDINRVISVGDQPEDNLNTRVHNYIHSSHRVLHDSLDEFEEENDRLFSEAASQLLLDADEFTVSDGNASVAMGNSWEEESHLPPQPDVQSNVDSQQPSTNFRSESPTNHPPVPTYPSPMIPFLSVDHNTTIYQQSRRVIAESEYRNLLQNLDPHLINQFQTLSSLLDGVAMGTLHRLVNFQNSLFNRRGSTSDIPGDMPTLSDMNSRTSSYYGTRIDSVGLGSSINRLSNNNGDSSFGEFMNSLRNENLLARELAGPFINQNPDSMRSFNNIFSDSMNHEPNHSNSSGAGEGTTRTNNDRQIMSFFRAFRFDNARHLEYVTSSRQHEDLIPVLIVGVVGTPLGENDSNRRTDGQGPRHNYGNRQHHHHYHRGNSDYSNGFTYDNESDDSDDSRGPVETVSWDDTSIFSDHVDVTDDTTAPDAFNQGRENEDDNGLPDRDSFQENSGLNNNDNRTDSNNLRSWVIIVMAHHYPASDPVLSSMPLFVDLLFEYAARSSLGGNSNNNYDRNRHPFSNSEEPLNSFSPEMATFRNSLWNFFSEAGYGQYKRRPTKDQLNKKTANLFTVKIVDEDQTELEKSKKEQFTANKYPKREFSLSETCPICLLDYCDEDIGRELDGCKHVFHKTCIDEWLSNGENSCPLCRTKGMEVN